MEFFFTYVATDWNRVFKPVLAWFIEHHVFFGHSRTFLSLWHSHHVREREWQSTETWHWKPWWRWRSTGIGWRLGMGEMTLQQNWRSSFGLMKTHVIPFRSFCSPHLWAVSLWTECASPLVSSSWNTWIISRKTRARQHGLALCWMACTWSWVKQNMSHKYSWGSCPTWFVTCKCFCIFIGPIAAALANKFGCRPVAIVGSIWSTIAFFASTYSPTIDILIVTYGVLGGEFIITKVSLWHILFCN